jgi:hypothetical protein
MDIAKLKKQLLREAKANPKKAIALGLLTTVAVWFWVPLVAGGLGDSGEEKPKSEPSAAGDDPMALAPPSWREAMQQSVAGSGEPETETPDIPWKQLAEWREQDPKTLPVIAPVVKRDPFQPPPSRLAEARLAEAEAEEEPEPEPIVEPEFTPEDAGLRLSSTLVSRRNRLALINGKTYRVGDTVPVANSKEEADATTSSQSATEPEPRPGFVVVEIDSRSVWLERLGKRYELLLPQDSGGGRVEVVNFAR